MQRSSEKLLNRTSLRYFITVASLNCAMLLASSPAFAGGFQLSVETPGGSADPQLRDVVLIARTYGCHQPADAKLSATAEGIVDGNRKSLPLEMRSIGSGVYAIRQQWPSEGTWVLAIGGSYNGMQSSVIVELGPKGRVFPDTRLEEGNLKGVHANGMRRAWVAKDIDALFGSSAGITSDATADGDPSVFSRFRAIAWILAALGASVVTIGFVRSMRQDRTPRQVST